MEQLLRSKAVLSCSWRLMLQIMVLSGVKLSKLLPDKKLNIKLVKLRLLQFLVLLLLIHSDLINFQLIVRMLVLP